MNKTHFICSSAAMLCVAIGLAVSLNSTVSASNAVGSAGASLTPIKRILPYRDEDYGFELAVPDKWVRIFVAEDDADKDALEPGYAVGFESPKSGTSDVFADYLMVEILPGADSGAFESNGLHTQVIMVDGRVAVTDRINLDGFDINGNSIDLVVFQAEIVELGFTVGIFAIGEQREADVLADAFQLALKTFKVPDDPFSVS